MGVLIISTIGRSIFGPLFFENARASCMPGRLQSYQSALDFSFPISLDLFSRKRKLQS